MVSYKTSMAAFVAALGMGSAASAAVVTISQSFYNTSSSTRRFSFSQFVQGTGIGAGTPIMLGSLTITLTDMNGNGARFANSGTDPIYRATIDGISVKTLNPYSMPFTFTTPFDSRSTVPVNFNEPVPANVNASGALGIATVFELSAGDAAYVSATFEVIPAPAPAVLLGMAGLVGASRRRRA